MNVNDQWMLERMQQMAANMVTTLPQTSQNSEVPKTEKGDSFKDLMDKAKEQKMEAPRKDSAAQKKEPVQSKEPVQKAEQPQTAKDTTRVNLDSNTAALVAAGYAQVLEVFEDGSALILLDAEKTGGGFSIVGSGLLTEGQKLTPVTITNAMGQKVTVSPEQIQEVFERFGVDGPQKSENGLTLVGQLNPEEHQNMIVRTLDGRFMTLKEAAAEAESGEEEPEAGGEAIASEPLFKDVKAAPIKVGESFQLDTQEPDMDANLADAIRYAAQQGLRQVEIKLSPENLGALTIKLTQSVDGSLQVVLHTANAKAANLLTQHLDHLNAALQGYGQSEVRVEVQRNENGQQAEQQFQQANPDGHNQQHRQQERRQEQEHSEDFIQRLRLGLFGLEDAI